MDIIESVIDRRAYGLAPDLAEARSHRLAGRLHDAPGAGGDAAEVLEEVRRRLAVGPEHDERVAEAALDARAGRRPRWCRPCRSASRCRARRACRPAPVMFARPSRRS